MLSNLHVLHFSRSHFHFSVVFIRTPAKQPKLAEQWEEAHWVGKPERSDEHLLAIRGSTFSARAIRRKPHDEQLNLESVKAVL